jgi:outer membrane immunogenic protein
MRRIMMAGMILTASAVGASAGDFDWAGAYAGIHAGLGAGQNTASYSSTVFSPAFVPGSIQVGPFGPLAGVQAGIQGRQGIGVFGFEADAAWAGMTGSGTVSPLVTNMALPGTFLTATQSINWLATARIRAGLLANSDQMLFYLTGGVIAGGVNYSSNGNVHPGMAMGTFFTAPASASKTKFGWTFGGGGEAVVGENWTLKAEALYFDLGNETIVGNLVNPSGVPQPPSAGTFVSKFTTTGVLFRAGLNKHF